MHVTTTRYTSSHVVWIDVCYRCVSAIVPLLLLSIQIDALRGSSLTSWVLQWVEAWIDAFYRSVFTMTHQGALALRITTLAFRHCLLWCVTLHWKHHELPWCAISLLIREYILSLYVRFTPQIWFNATSFNTVNKSECIKHVKFLNVHWMSYHGMLP